MMVFLHFWSCPDLDTVVCSREYNTTVVKLLL